MKNIKVSSAFFPARIGSLELKNRLVRSATFESRAENGKVTDELIEFYRTLAKGGVGLIITGHCAIHPEGYMTPRMTKITEGADIALWKRISQAVHKA
ncbi:MAG: oxidase, partial [Deltaproteobacteria bacterium]|nr:oxidase [Deltaproteobacteria bacterium]